ncbi:MAG: O-antigen ligase family protein [Elusimicrobia bacterium]|nr:O-antigen ligase family protein [Elusimicrobiota bacterium]
MKQAIRPERKEITSGAFWDTIPLLLWTLTLFLVPLVPDEKLVRLKLIVFEVGWTLSFTAWILRQSLRERFQIYRTPADFFLLLYLVSSILFYLFSENRGAAFSELERTLFSAGCYFLTVQVSSGEHGSRSRRVLLTGWISGLFLVSLYSILQISGGIWKLSVPQSERVFGTFGNPIFFAAFLILSLPIAVAWFLGCRKNLQKILIFCAAFLGSVALCATETRAAFLSLAISLVLFFLLSEWSSSGRWMKRIWELKSKVILFLILLFLAHFLAVSGSEKYRSFFSAAQGKFFTSHLAHTHQTHTLIWKDVLRMWRSHPWLGTGFGTFHVEFPQYASDELKKLWPQNQRIVNDAHNEYLQTLAETGVVGFSIFFSVLASFFAGSLFFFFNPKQGLTGTDRALFAGLGVGVTSLLLQNFFSVDMRFIVSSAYVFLAMGLCGAYFSRESSLSWLDHLGSGTRKMARTVGLLLILWVVGRGLLPSIFRPYLSQKAISQSPDFFDEKLMNAAQTIQDLENLTRQFPLQWRYWDRLGYAYAKEMQKRDPSGKKLIDLQVTEKAVQSYLTAHQLNPSAEGPANNLGNIYFTIQRRGEAIQWWKKAAESNPQGVDSRLNLGTVYYLEGRVKESVGSLEEVLKIDPHNQKAIVLLKQMTE